MGREGWWESEKQKGMLASARMHLNVALSSHLSHMSQAVPNPTKFLPPLSQCPSALSTCTNLTWKAMSS